MINKNSAFILEDDFYDTIRSKNNCLEIELNMMRFLNNRKDNQFLAIDTSRDCFRERTVFMYIEVNGSRYRVYDVRYFD